jgi:hypothetical protein
LGKDPFCLVIAKLAMTMKKNPKEPDNATNATSTLNVLPALLRRTELARQIGVSPRSVDNFLARKIIPAVRISRRCIRYSLPAVLAALRKFEIREAGR